MSKQQTAVEWLVEQLNDIVPDGLRERVNTLKGEANQIFEQQQSKITIDYFNWLFKNEYKYNPKEKMYQKTYINETLFFTTKELFEQYYNETFNK